jgi:hypothetical protein
VGVAGTIRTAAIVDLLFMVLPFCCMAASARRLAGDGWWTPPRPDVRDAGAEERWRPGGVAGPCPTPGQRGDVVDPEPVDPEPVDPEEGSVTVSVTAGIVTVLTWVLLTVTGAAWCVTTTVAARCRTVSRSVLCTVEKYV